MSDLSSRFGIFRDRDYALYALGNTVSSLGMWAQRVGVGWLSWDLSHSASWVGLVSLAQFLPLIFLAPLFGGLLDRCDPKRYAIVTNSVLMALAAALYAVTTLHALTIETLCGLSVLVGIANSAYHPVRLSLVNHVAPPGRLAQAIATNSILYNLTRSLGPAFAGIAIASLGVAATFAINAISYAAIIGALAVIDIRAAPRNATDGFVREFVAGIHYVADHRFIRELMLLSAVASIFGRGVVELLPAVAGDLYQRGSSGLAVLTTASGVGAVIGGVLLSKSGNADWLLAIASRGAIWLGVGVVVLAAVPTFSLTAGAILVLGIFGVVCGVGLQVLLQKAIDESFRGRVLGLWGMCNVAGPGIGGALIGAAAQVFGLRGATMASGLVCAALAAWIMRRGRDLSGGAIVSESVDQVRTVCRRKLYTDTQN
jgi:MFS family permease